MRIAVISGTYPPLRCGVGDYVSESTSALIQLGHDVHVLTSVGAAPGPGIDPSLRTWSWRSWRSIIKKLNRLSPDVVVIHCPTAAYGRTTGITFLPAVLRAVTSHRHIVVVAHEFHDTGNLGRLRIAVMSPFTALLVTTNRRSAQLMRRTLRRRVTEIPIGSNIAVTPLSGEQIDRIRENHRGDREFLVVCFGFVDRDKGTLDGIRALSDSGVDARLVLATHEDSSDPFHTEVRQTADDLALDLLWTGFLPPREVSGLLQAADLLLLPYRQPASLRRGGLVAGLVHGCAILTTGPVDPPLRSGAHVWTTAAGDPGALASAITHLLSDLPLRQHLGRQASTLGAGFGWDLIAARYVDLITQSVPARSA